MRINLRELQERESRRELILKRICPSCAGYLFDNSAMRDRSPKYDWFTCGKCETTMGVQIRELVS